jgi:hypothetical protein
MDVAVRVDAVVQRFSKGHKYTLGWALARDDGGRRRADRALQSATSVRGSYP